MSKSKRIKCTIEISARDAAMLSLMLSLHRAYSQEQVSKALPVGLVTDPAERERINQVVRSWARHTRKAQAFAAMFDDAKRTAEMLA